MERYRKLIDQIKNSEAEKLERKLLKNAYTNYLDKHRNIFCEQQTYHHHNRVHDKVFAFNSMLIALLFYLSINAKERMDYIPYLFSVVVFNMLLLIYLEHHMKETHRLYANKDQAENQEESESLHSKRIDENTKCSLFSLFLLISSLVLIGLDLYFK